MRQDFNLKAVVRGELTSRVIRKGGDENYSRLAAAIML
jgi:hypothetical protein